MHQLESYGYSGRDGVRRMRGESPEDYRQALLDDAYSSPSLMPMVKMVARIPVSSRIGAATVRLLP